MRLLTFIFSIAAALAVMFSPVTASAASDPIYTSFMSNNAVGGYDTVAYFTEGAPVKGSSDYSTDYMGATFKFSSQENLDKFKANPTAFAPQYGGYCAWAIAHDKTAKGNPKNWTIVDGKLYLNYNSSIQEKWTADKAALIQKADGYWPAVLN